MTASVGSEVMVRMGELAASDDAGATLVSLALGSCVGVCLVDRRRGIAGLAHVMLPESTGRVGDSPSRFADTAVPLLLDEVVSLGALKARLDVSIVGGAQMFSFQSTSAGVGARNELAVREALERLGLRIGAERCGGTAGRTVRVHVETGEVFVKVAGGAQEQIA